MKFGMYVEVDEWCITSMTRSKVKVMVTSPLKSEIRPFLNAIFSPIYNGGSQMTYSYIMAYTFWVVCVAGGWSRDHAEPGRTARPAADQDVVPAWSVFRIVSDVVHGVQ